MGFQTTIKRTKTPTSALSSLMRMCARAERCVSDAERLLIRWEIAPTDREEIIHKLIDQRFIDNLRYAEAYTREKSRLSGWGAQKIRAALSRKRIAKDTIDTALEQIDQNRAIEKLKLKLQRKEATIKASSPYDKRNKLIRYGLTQGFDYDQVIEIIEQITRDSHEDQ